MKTLERRSEITTKLIGNLPGRCNNLRGKSGRPWTVEGVREGWRRTHLRNFLSSPPESKAVVPLKDSSSSRPLPRTLKVGRTLTPNSSASSCNSSTSTSAKIPPSHFSASWLYTGAICLHGLHLHTSKRITTELSEGKRSVEPLTPRQAFLGEGGAVRTD